MSNGKTGQLCAAARGLRDQASENEPCDPGMALLRSQRKSLLSSDTMRRTGAPQHAAAWPYE